MSRKSSRPPRRSGPGGVVGAPNPLISRAAELCRQGRLDEAEALMRGVSAFASRDHPALHMLGIIARQKGDNIRATEFFCRAIAINGRVAAYHGNLGNVYLQSGRIGEAAGCFRRALELEPSSAQARFGLGLALLGQNAHAAAARELEAAVKARPDHAPTHLNFGIALTELGRFEEAVAHCRRAVVLTPDYAGNHFRLGIALRAAHDLGAAYDHLARAVKLDPKLADAHYQLGVTLIALDRPDEAARALRQALVLRPDQVEALHQLGWVLKEMQIFEEAMRCYECALALDPGSPALVRGMAHVFYAQGRFEEARAWFTKVVELEPGSAQGYVEIGRTHESEGRFEEAITCQKKAIALQPDNADAHYSLAMMRRFDNRDGRIRELQRVLGLDSLDGERRATLNFTLAQMYDEVGEYDTAFRHYKTGNDLRKVRRSYQPEEYSAFVDRVIASFGQGLFDQKKGIGSGSERPVFVVGMMRSGTTLVEQILASHPQVHGHGELWYMRELARGLPEQLGSSEPYPECIASLDAAMAQRLADAYLARLRGDTGETARSIDKLPHNFMRLGLIALLFPRARQIHCMRDPLDTCLSCYLLSDVNTAFAEDLEFLGRFYRDYRRLMSHWRSILPSQILDVPYEGLVTDPESWSRKLVAFLGLPWDERCLAFYETDRPVYTPSFWQVRQPVYASSIGRWRHYAKHLGPLFTSLGITPPGE